MLAAEVCYIGADYSVVACIRSKDGDQCEYTDEYFQIRQVAGGILVAYAAIWPLLLLLLLLRATRGSRTRARQARDGERMAKAQTEALGIFKLAEAKTVAALEDALRSVYAPFKPQFFYFELVDLARKLLLLGVIVFVSPGSLLQILTGMAIAACVLTIEVHAAALRVPSDGHFASVAGLGILMVLIACFMQRLGELTDTLAANEVQPDLWSSLAFDGSSAVLMLFATTLVVFAVFAILTIYDALASWSTVRLVRHKRSHEPLELPERDGSMTWHVFISYARALEPEQLRLIKHLLKEVVPGIRIFLDADHLDDHTGLEATVATSQALVVFASGGYFASRCCVRELRTAAEHCRRIVFLRECAVEKSAINLADEVKKIRLTGDAKAAK